MINFNTQKRFLFLGLMGLALVSAMAGCNRGGSGSAGGTSGTPGDARAGRGLKVVYIPKNTGNPYFNEVDKGFQTAAKELGFTYTLSAPATAEATSQIEIIKAQIQQGVDVIAISANSPDALNLVLDQAKDKGITVITVDSDLVGNEGHRSAAVLPADFNDIGPAQVELLGSLMNYQGSFAILSATTDAPNQNAWIAKMKDTLKQPKYAKMSLVDTVYGDDEPQKSTTECEGLLAKHPDLGGIISPTSVGLAASAQVVERTGVYPGGAHAIGKGLQLTGLSTPNQLKKFVQEGAVNAFQLWAPFNEGYLAGYAGVMIHERTVTPAAGTSVDSPKLGKKPFSAKLELIAGPLLTFDKKNIAKFDY